MNDAQVVCTSRLEDGAGAWLTDRHAWIDEPEQAPGFEHTQLTRAAQAARLAQTASPAQCIARPRTLLGRLSPNRQA